MSREDYRRENARDLARQAGGQAEFGRKLGMNDSQVSQIIGKNPKKNIGNSISKRIEIAFGKPAGWLDVSHDDDPPIDTASERNIAAALQDEGWTTYALRGDPSSLPPEFTDGPVPYTPEFRVVKDGVVLYVDVRWVEGDAPDNADILFPNLVGIFNDDIEDGIRRLNEKAAEYKTKRNTLNTIHAIHPDDEEREDIIYVPESRIEFAAGNGRTATYELIEDQEPASYRLSWFHKHRINPHNVRRFRVSGDSMEPLLFARDTILVNLDETSIIDGKLYAIRYGDELRVKYLRRLLDGTLILRSVNPLYDDERIPPELAQESISIIGRVRDRSGTGGL